MMVSGDQIPHSFSSSFQNWAPTALNCTPGLQLPIIQDAQFV
jgi:hypothetical protein